MAEKWRVTPVLIFTVGGLLDGCRVGRGCEHPVLTAVLNYVLLRLLRLDVEEILPVRILHTVPAALESLPVGVESVLQLHLSSPSSSSSSESPADTHLCFGVNFPCLCCWAHVGWPLFSDTFCFSPGLIE